MTIREANKQDVYTIHKLAQEIWWPTYEPILSKEQINFMLEQSYSELALEEQMNDGMNFILAERDAIVVAFAGYSNNFNEPICTLHKLYILPSEQGRGTGKKLIQHIIKLSQQNGANILELNVNRNNPALGFYKAIGFEIFKEVDIPYYGFVLNDFVLRMTINNC
ncbi:MAG: GCN5-related N-acetyltransferase [Daejeonella sp.]|nr:GCN5-related N-acetyltransferase [Daejeonella sp.]